MIKQVFLRNYKCFEEQALPFGKLTLLAGLNGMGKSSVLQALLLLRQSYLDGLLPDTGLALNGTLVQMGTAQDVLYEDAQSNDFEIAVTWTDDAKTSFILQYHREADVLKIDPTKINRSIFKRPLFSDGFQYLQAERLGPRTTNSVSDHQVRELRQVGTAGEYTEHFLHVFGAEKVQDGMVKKDDSLPNDLRNQVQAWLNEISPGTQLHIAIHPEMDIVNLRYSFVTGKERSNQYRATSVGFGITYILPVLTAVLSSKPGSLIIIENPEAHIHPRGQVLMGELLARAAVAGVQVIVETHSDHVLNGVRLAVHGGVLDHHDVAMHFISRIEEGGRVHSKVESPVIDKNGRIDKWPDGFFDEWDKSLEHLLAPRKE